MLIDGLEMAYVNGFAYKIVRPVADEEVPERFERAEEVFDGQVLARAAARLERDVQAGLDEGSPGAAVGRPRRALRRATSPRI